MSRCHPLLPGACTCSLRFVEVIPAVLLLILAALSRSWAAGVVLAGEPEGEEIRDRIMH